MTRLAAPRQDDDMGMSPMSSTPGSYDDNDSKYAMLGEGNTPTRRHTQLDYSITPPDSAMPRDSIAILGSDAGTIVEENPLMNSTASVASSKPAAPQQLSEAQAKAANAAAMNSSRVVDGKRPAGNFNPSGSGFAISGPGFTVSGPGVPLSVPGKSAGFNPASSGFNPNRSGFHPASSGFHPASSGINSSCGGHPPQPPRPFNPAASGFNPARSGFNPASSGFNPSRSGFNPSGSGFNMIGSGTTTPGISNQPLLPPSMQDNPFSMSSGFPRPDGPTRARMGMGTMLARANRNMSLLELNELKDAIVRGSVQSSIMDTVDTSFIDDSIRSTGNYAGSLPSRESAARPLFFDAQLYAKEAVGEMRVRNKSIGADSRARNRSVGADTRGRKKSVYDQPIAEEGAFLPMAREGAAMLIDAVRGANIAEDDKCRFLFDTFDVDKKGVLSKEGVRAFLEATFVANNMMFYGEFNFQDVVDKLFSVNKNSDNMTFAEFKVIFGDIVQPPNEKDLGKISSLIEPIQRNSMMLANKGDLDDMTSSYKYRFVRFWSMHHSQIFWLSVYFIILIVAFILKARKFAFDPAVGYCPRIAKGFAQICMVNTLFVLLPMCRDLVTWLRRIAVVVTHVPIDDHIEFHKISGIVMLIASLGHTIPWVFIVYYVKTVPEATWEKSKYYHLHFVRSETIFELLLRVPIWTGVLMLLIAAIAAPLTHPKVRRGNFNAFWLTHLLFIPFIILIGVHGLAMWVAPPQAYWWILPPLIIYLAEKRYRMGRGGTAKLLRAQVSANSVALFMKKPRNFGKNRKFTPGMYMFVNIPAISKFEWHPFTISSAPEDRFLSLHIQRAGDWTGMLYIMMSNIENELMQDGGDPQQHIADPNLLESRGMSPTLMYPTIYLDGPVGAPAQDYSRYREVVFVGAGIGVTPFASILRSIVHQWEAFRCPDCRSMRFPETFQIRKIYFYWVTREQEALSWFSDTMNELSELDTEGRLEIHNYFSSIKRESVIAPLQAVQKYIHATEGQDIISGLHIKQMTHFGRPNWKAELKRISANHDQLEPLEGLEDEKEEIGVFFCGPKPLGNTIHNECVAFNQKAMVRQCDVTYDFHSENF